VKDTKTLSQDFKALSGCPMEKNLGPWSAGFESVPVVLRFDIEEHDFIEAALGLMSGYSFIRAVDLARRLQERREMLPRFCLAF
jgi:hypothetical protein